MTTQLGLGTVQFGMPYGISNQIGQTAHDELVGILTLASEAGVQVLDTAALYGESESALGAALKKNHPFRIVTKTPKFGPRFDPVRDALEVARALERSLSNLRQQQVYALLAHDADNLLSPGGDAMWSTMQGLQRQGLVGKIGVSIYAAQQLDAVLTRFDPNLIQLPISILDQRLLESGHLVMLKSRNVEVHARSIFLQGLLLMSPANMPHHFRRFSSELSAYSGFLARHDLSPVDGALSFIRHVGHVDVALIGVNCRAQLEECIDVFRAGSVAEIDFSEAACHNEMLLNPALWPSDQRLEKPPNDQP